MSDWEKKYSDGKECNVAPFDEVITFVYRYKPQRSNKQIKIMEVGCGTGNNINFLAHQGFQTYGIEQSPTACAIAKQGFSKISNGSFIDLPWPSDHFDMVIDRAALAFATTNDLFNAIDEVWRVLVPCGRFLFTPYAMPEHKNDAFFYEQYDELRKYFRTDLWRTIAVEKAQTVNFLTGEHIEAHWRIVVEKNPPS